MSTPVTGEELAHLQLLVLEAVLRQRPLPGGEGTVSFPDLPILMARGSVPILAEGLRADLTGVPDLPGHVVTAIEASGETDELEAYLQFLPPEIEDGVVRIVLDALVASRPGLRAVGLGRVVVGFRRVNGDWTVVEDPTVSAF